MVIQLENMRLLGITTLFPYGSLLYFTTCHITLFVSQLSLVQGQRLCPTHPCIPDGKLSVPIEVDHCLWNEWTRMMKPTWGQGIKLLIRHLHGYLTGIQNLILMVGRKYNRRCIVGSQLHRNYSRNAESARWPVRRRKQKEKRDKDRM